MRVQLHGVARDTYAVPRRGVAGDGDIRRANADGSLDADYTRNIEDDDARSALFARLTETAGARIIEIGHHQDLATVPAKRIHAAAPRAGKGGDLRLRKVPRFGCAGNVRFAFLRPGFDFRQRATPGLVGKLRGFGSFLPPGLPREARRVDQRKPSTSISSVGSWSTCVKRAYPRSGR